MKIRTLLKRVLNILGFPDNIIVQETQVNKPTLNKNIKNQQINMTPQFKDIIQRYLHSEIPYALLIDGKWGSGKTWYIKNRFKEDFGKEVVYTSANGITSIDDLTQQIL
jgi:Cdc6-like AAA superfamily ATPase